jgi:hypothetical protein
MDFLSLAFLYPVDLSPCLLFYHGRVVAKKKNRGLFMDRGNEEREGVQKCNKVVNESVIATKGVFLEGQIKEWEMRFFVFFLLFFLSNDLWNGHVFREFSRAQNCQSSRWFSLDREFSRLWRYFALFLYLVRCLYQIDLCLYHHLGHHKIGLLLDLLLLRHIHWNAHCDHNRDLGHDPLLLFHEI